jgi:hypothetical protein
LIYLFVQFSKPVEIKKEGEDSDSDDGEMNNVNLDMIYYVKNMPKMRRIKDVDYNVDGVYASAK